MTMAVCLKCGEIKLGAFTPCPACKFAPESSADKSKAMLLTDHLMNQERLKQVSQGIKDGKELIYQPDELEKIEKVLNGKSSQDKSDRQDK